MYILSWAWNKDDDGDPRSMPDVWGNNDQQHMIKLDHG